MKQIAQYQDGRLEIQEVPEPVAPAGGILVRLTHSVISAGTEKMKVEQARMNLLQKARARPDQVRKVLDTARTLGWSAALGKVRNRLATPAPLGYSAAGVVIGVDPGNPRFRIGERVAVGGAECAWHAEVVAVPDLLAAHVPEGVENWQAAYTTVASIALQAVRRLEAQLGDRVLVMGQGLVGLLVTSLLRASAVRVMAVDIAAARAPFARALGAEQVVIAGAGELQQQVRKWTGGHGVDAVVLVTAAASNQPTTDALHALRDRGRIVVVGKTRVDLDWNLAYAKEIDVRYSRSYGPGRYDPHYEWRGLDYPIGYVRWTEQRNFEACLHLMRTGGLELPALTTRRVAFAEARAAYESLLGEAGSREVGIVLEYEPGSAAAVVEMASGASPAPGPGAAPAAPATGRLAAPVARIDVLGAGNFARTMLLPHLRGRLPLGTVVNQTGLSAEHVRSRFGFAHAATDAAAALADEVNAGLLIATRHHLHAGLVCAALAAHRHVFVEKPLCLTRAELAAIATALAASRGSVQVGFNRRFAPAAVALRHLLAETPGAKTVSYRVMAGVLDPAHWYANVAESGGRVLGEACHFLDFFCFLLDAPPVRVSAQAVAPVGAGVPAADSVAVQVEFADGSCGQLLYSAEGDGSWPKEVCTVFGAGLCAEIENFQRLVWHRDRRRHVQRFHGKGHAEQMAAWLAFLEARADHPLAFPASRGSMLLTFAALDALRAGGTVSLREI